jgi:hypothetical protein
MDALQQFQEGTNQFVCEVGLLIACHFFLRGPGKASYLWLEPEIDDIP